MAKSKHNSIKKMQQMWSSFASNSSWSKIHWDEHQKPDPIEAIVDGWKFTLFNNKHTIRLEAVSETTSCGIGIKVSAYINTPFDNDTHKWAYKIMQPDDTATDPEKGAENQSRPEQEVCFDVAIKSMDDSYKKWFDVWSINQSGVSFKFNSKKHKEIMQKLLNLGELMEKMKVRILLEKLS
jgi:hypothetical protein